MKIDLIERGGLLFLRKMWLGFLPLYWDDGWEGGWNIWRYTVSKERGEELLRIWSVGFAQKSRFAASKENVIKSISI